MTVSETLRVYLISAFLEDTLSLLALVGFLPKKRFKGLRHRLSFASTGQKAANSVNHPHSPNALGFKAFQRLHFGCAVGNEMHHCAVEVRRRMLRGYVSISFRRKWKALQVPKWILNITHLELNCNFKWGRANVINLCKQIESMRKEI